MHVHSSYQCSDGLHVGHAKRKKERKKGLGLRLVSCLGEGQTEGKGFGSVFIMHIYT